MEYKETYFIPTVTISLEEHKRLEVNDELAVVLHEKICVMNNYFYNDESLLKDHTDREEVITHMMLLLAEDE